MEGARAHKFLPHDGYKFPARVMRGGCASSTFMCVDCGTRAIDGIYMVHDHLWPIGKLDGMLCIGCLETRIGRQLTPDDFTDASCNIEDRFIYRSRRHMDRLGTPRAKPTDYYELMAYVLAEFNGTPEEFGETLQIAIGLIPEWTRPEDRSIKVAAKAMAKRVIKALDGGAELLELERSGVV